LWLPARPAGLVLVLRTGRNDPHLQSGAQVEDMLRAADYATLSMDLLLDLEALQDEGTGRFHLDVPFLADRICLMLAWARHQPQLIGLPVGVIAAGTTVAGAVTSAAHHPDEIKAIVSRSGRADLAEHGVLTAVRAAVLQLAYECEPHTIDLNRLAARQLSAPHRVDILPDVPGRTSPDSGIVARLACEWFAEYMTRSSLKGATNDRP
jgi:hypothetical protein